MDADDFAEPSFFDADWQPPIHENYDDIIEAAHAHRAAAATLMQLPSEPEMALTIAMMPPSVRPHFDTAAALLRASRDSSSPATPPVPAPVPAPPVFSLAPPTAADFDALYQTFAANVASYMQRVDPNSPDAPEIVSNTNALLSHLSTQTQHLAMPIGSPIKRPIDEDAVVSEPKRVEKPAKVKRSPAARETRHLQHSNGIVAPQSRRSVVMANLVSKQQAQHEKLLALGISLAVADATDPSKHAPPDDVDFNCWLPDEIWHGIFFKLLSVRERRVLAASCRYLREFFVRFSQASVLFLCPPEDVGREPPLFFEQYQQMSSRGAQFAPWNLSGLIDYLKPDGTICLRLPKTPQTQRIVWNKLVDDLLELAQKPIDRGGRNAKLCIRAVSIAKCPDFTRLDRCHTLRLERIEGAKEFGCIGRLVNLDHIVTWTLRGDIQCGSPTNLDKCKTPVQGIVDCDFARLERVILLADRPDDPNDKDLPNAWNTYRNIDSRTRHAKKNRDGIVLKVPNAQSPAAIDAFAKELIEMKEFINRNGIVFNSGVQAMLVLRKLKSLVKPIDMLSHLPKFLIPNERGTFNAFSIAKKDPETQQRIGTMTHEEAVESFVDVCRKWIQKSLGAPAL